MRRVDRAARRCPKCGVGMREFQLEGVRLEMCPRCAVLWFDAGELPRAAGLRFDDGLRGRALAGARRTHFRCPACAIPLYERELGERSALMVEQCPQCAGMFLDRGEFSRVKAHFHAAGAAPQPMPRPSDPVDTTPTVDEDGWLLTVFQYLSGLPVELDTPQTMFPPVVVGLIVVNVAVLVAAYAFGFDDWLQRLALVAGEVTAGRHLSGLFTHMFMHGGVFHLLGNMYFLYVLGDNIEDRFGSVPFLGFYLGCGLVAALAQIAGEPRSMVPAVGASGAIAGVLGAYMVLYPMNRLLLRGWWRFGFYFRSYRWEVPAIAYLAFWLLFQLIYASLDVPGVAWWAHIGGFACGAGIALAVRLWSLHRGDMEATEKGKAF